MPRKYRMDKRDVAVEETQRRIIEATLALHSEQGMFGTSWKHIAVRANVSVGTVYNHFPSLDELAPACGALIMDITEPPSLEDAPRIFGDAQAPRERLERLVSAMFAFYERAGPYLEIGPRERQLSAVQAWEGGMRAVREGLAREALHLVVPDERTVRAMSAMLDFPVFKSFRRHELQRAEAESIVNELLLCGIIEARGSW